MTPGTCAAPCRPPAKRSRQTWWLWWGVLSVLAMSVWGSWHRVAHSPTQPGWVVAMGGSQDGHLAGSDECRLLDQAVCDLGWGPPSQALHGLTLQAAPPLGPPPTGTFTRCDRVYAARAPPLAI